MHLYIVAIRASCILVLLTAAFATSVQRERDETSLLQVAQAGVHRAVPGPISLPFDGPYVMPTIAPMEVEAGQQPIQDSDFEVDTGKAPDFLEKDEADTEVFEQRVQAYTWTATGAETINYAGGTHFRDGDSIGTPDKKIKGDKDKIFPLLRVAEMLGLMKNGNATALTPATNLTMHLQKDLNAPAPAPSEKQVQIASATLESTGSSEIKQKWPEYSSEEWLVKQLVCGWMSGTWQPCTIDPFCFCDGGETVRSQWWLQTTLPPWCTDWECMVDTGNAYEASADDEANHANYVPTPAQQASIDADAEQEQQVTNQAGGAWGQGGLR